MIAGFLICLALAAVVGGVLVVCAAAAGGMADDHEDEFAAQRTPGMGDLSTVPETQIVHEHRQRLAESDEHPVIASARTRPYLASVLARRELEDEALAERLREWGQE